MDNTVGFYPSDGSSILSRRTKLIKHSNICESGVKVATGDLKSPVLMACGFDSRLSHQIRADSLMVKQGTHNALSESSILSQPTN